MLPVEIADFGTEVRFTGDGRVSVYDAITFATGQKNPRDVWDRLQKGHPEVVGKCDNFKFPGRGQRDTPVADLQVFLEILVILPGRLAARVREEAVRTLIRAMDGDLALVDEILERVKSSQSSSAVSSEAVTDEFEYPYAKPEFFGTVSNPLTSIPSTVRSGYGWKGNEALMESWLVRLASYRGMYIHRQAPHRAYSSTGKASSRRIDLILIPLFDDESAVLSVYEFKSDYIDDYDVKDTFYSKNYIDIVIREFLKKGIKFSKVRGRLVAPGGVTEAAVMELKQIQELLKTRYEAEDFEIELDALPLHQMVWDEMYPAIASKYEDEEGKFGYGFLISSVRSLCCMLTNPKPWIGIQKSLKVNLLKTRTGELSPASGSSLDELSAECDEIANSMVEVLIESGFGKS